MVAKFLLEVCLELYLVQAAMNHNKACHCTYAILPILVALSKVSMTLASSHLPTYP